MKIAITGPAYPYRGGIANFSERLAKELIAQGDDVQLYTFSMMYPDFIFPGKTQYAETPLSFDLKIERTINSVNPLSWIQTANQIKNNKFDLVLSAFSIPFLSPALGTIARRAKKNQHTKTISIIHNLHPHEARPADETLSGYFLNSMDAHLALSQKVADDISRQTKHPVIFYPHPVYDIYGSLVEKQKAKSELQLDPDARYILFFGLVRDYKGLDLLLEAMATAPIKNQNIKLLVAGEFYSDKKNYTDIIEKNNIQDKVILYDRFIPENEVYKYFSAADIVVQPYKNATQSGITQIAYQFNKPMIVTNVGALPETVPDNKVGFVCEPEPHSIAKAILRFYEENKEQEFSASAALEKQKYSWSGLANALKSLYLSLP